MKAAISSSSILCQCASQSSNNHNMKTKMNHNKRPCHYYCHYHNLSQNHFNTKIIISLLLLIQVVSNALSLHTQLNSFQSNRRTLTKIKSSFQLHQNDRYTYLYERTRSSLCSNYQHDDNNKDETIETYNSLDGEMEEDDEDDDIYFGKFQTDDEDDTLAGSNNEAPNKSLSAFANVKDETHLKIEQQQKQIDMLMEMMRNQSFQQQQQQQQVSSKPQRKQPPKKSKTNDDSLTLPPPLPGMFDDHQGEDELLDYTDEAINSSTEKSSPFSSVTPTTSNRQSNTGVVPLAPLKVMLFIDGTWLYYSLHRRKEDRDPIVKKFGRGWQYRYRFDWNALPRIICEELVGQQKNSVRFHHHFTLTSRIHGLKK